MQFGQNENPLLFMRAVVMKAAVEML